MLNRWKRRLFGASIYHSDDSEGFKYLAILTIYLLLFQGVKWSSLHREIHTWCQKINHHPSLIIKMGGWKSQKNPINLRKWSHTMSHTKKNVVDPQSKWWTDKSRHPIPNCRFLFSIGFRTLQQTFHNLWSTPDVWSMAGWLMHLCWKGMFETRKKRSKPLETDKLKKKHLMIPKYPNSNGKLFFSFPKHLCFNGDFALSFWQGHHSPSILSPQNNADWTGPSEWGELWNGRQQISSKTLENLTVDRQPLFSKK